VSQRLQLASKIKMVVKLSIEDDPDAPIFVGHRLDAALEVNDAQAPVAEGRRSAPEEAVAASVGAAVGVRCGKTFDESSDVAPTILRQHPGDAAHQARTKVARPKAEMDKLTASVMGRAGTPFTRRPAETLN
jgi:hypothetical protein